MAPRAFWTGHLRLSLVNIPVKLYPATTSERAIALHQIHEPSGQRVAIRRSCPVSAGRERDDHQGLRIREGQICPDRPGGIDDLKLEAKQTIELVRFVDEKRSTPATTRRPTTCSPTATWRTRLFHHPEGAETPARSASASSSCAGAATSWRSSRSARASRSKCCARQRDSRAEPLFKEITEVKADKEAQDLAKELIKRKTGKFEPEALKDAYSEAVWELIQAKLEDRAPEIVTEMPGSAKVINIMDALKKSVQQGKGAKVAAKRGAAPARSGNDKKAAKGAPKRKSA
jgi:DNA end-binding protein Ku